MCHLVPNSSLSSRFVTLTKRKSSWQSPHLSSATSLMGYFIFYFDILINISILISIYRNFCTNNLKKFSLIKLNWAFISVRITVKGWLVGRGVEKTGLPRELEIRLFIPVAPYSSLTRDSSSFTYQMKTKIILEVFTVKPSKWWYQSEYIILAWHQPHSHTLQEEKLENVV